MNSETPTQQQTRSGTYRMIRAVPFFALHLACLTVFYVGFSWPGLLVGIAAYVLRMFAITAGFHRYFSHRSYKTSRLFQFVLAFIGGASAQKGALWWAAHHRHHHKHSDTDEDIHSPIAQGIWHSHVGWVLDSRYYQPDMSQIKDFTKYPELCFLNKFDLLAPVVFGFTIFGLGILLESIFPGVTRWQIFVWGFLVSTIALYHGTFCINSLAHVIGNRRFETTDHSKNSMILALITLGEGWHNNHHRYPGSERQGFYWWEIDISHYILKGLSFFGIVWDLRTPPKRIFEEAKATKDELKKAA